MLIVVYFYSGYMPVPLFFCNVQMILINECLLVPEVHGIYCFVFTVVSKWVSRIEEFHWYRYRLLNVWCRHIPATQWTVAHLSIIRIGGHAHLWCHLYVTFKRCRRMAARWALFRSPPSSAAAAIHWARILNSPGAEKQNRNHYDWVCQSGKWRGVDYNLNYDLRGICK